MSSNDTKNSLSGGVPEQHRPLVKDVGLCTLDFANLVDLIVKCSY